QNDFAGSETGVTVTINAGQYSVDETGGPSGYAKTLGAGCSGTMPVGGFVTCTITNDDTAPGLTLVKKLSNNAGGTASASASTTKTLTGVGSYTVNENTAAGYAASYSAACSSTISFGQTKTCTITNDDITPSLTLTKTLRNNYGGTATAAAFTLSATGPT